ncbi:MAG: hypothetical protein NZM35_11390, partial [Chitinophagales bacterium]|nr:hypothetical protein [Chitinophagales bacterium]MDW8419487.1 hypothetical protein [Chitinophagales bacterium]
GRAGYGVRFAPVLHCVTHRSLRSRPSHPSPGYPQSYNFPVSAYLPVVLITQNRPKHQPAVCDYTITFFRQRLCNMPASCIFAPSNLSEWLRKN